MRNSVRTLGITAALAVMIPLSAYAATTTGTTEKNTEGKASVASEWSAKGGALGDRGGFKRGGEIVSQEVLDLLKLDQAAFKEKVKAGSTLAEIAEAQGVSRDRLKSVMTEAFNKKLEERKQSFSDNLDKMIDSEWKADKQDVRGGGFHVSQDFTAIASVLGLSADEVKAQLKAGKSLADLAEGKGVDVQKLIDAQAAAITQSINQAVTDGKLTQEQADKQLADVAKIAERIVNGKGFGEGRHHGKGFGGGFGGERPSNADSAESSGSASPSVN